MKIYVTACAETSVSAKTSALEMNPVLASVQVEINTDWILDTQIPMPAPRRQQRR